MSRLALLLLWVLPLCAGAQQVDSTYHHTTKLMGCRFDFTVVAADQIQGDAYIDLAIAEISRIEHLISDWDATSQLSEVNRQAGLKPVAVDPELFNLIERSNAISRLTDGAFDVSYASMDKVWHFDGSMDREPTPGEVAASVSKIGYQRIVLDTATHGVFLPEAGMKIGFGGIGKGYAADRARDLLVSRGVRGGIINASGDLDAWGRQPDGSDWLVAITNPLNKAKAFAYMPVEDRAVVTSGDYEKYVRFGGVRYSHIIDPRTGYPATGIISATIFAPRAELADALATSVFVMGVETGVDFINQLPGVDVIIVDEANQIHTSNGIDLQNSTATK